MREIKFRGMNTDGEWLYGDLIHQDGLSHIAPIDSSTSIEDSFVMAVTVGQYTGLKDKNGKEIYEGDIVETIQPTGCKTFMPDGQIKLNSWVNKSSSVVEWQDDNNPRWKGCLRYGSGTLEIIGNIYENPELLEAQT